MLSFQISVEEVPESLEQNNSVALVIEPSNLAVPGRRATDRASSEGQQRKRRERHGRGAVEDQAHRGPPSAPGWLVELTQKYNVSIKTEKKKDDDEEKA